MVQRQQNDTTDLYSIEAFVELDVKTLKSASITFDCILSIPEANYTAHEYEDYQINSKYRPRGCFEFHTSWVAFEVMGIRRGHSSWRKLFLCV